MSDEETAKRSLPRPNEPLVKMARHRTVYDLALVFYGVLTVLALEHPLTVFTESIADNPSGHGLNDWTHRLLTLTLLVLAAIWLHTLVISLELNDTRRLESLYPVAICQFWAGVVMVIILMVLGKTVENGTTAFLAASLAYLVWSLLFAILGLVRAESKAKRIAKYDIAQYLAGLIILIVLAKLASRQSGAGWQFGLALTWMLLVLLSAVLDYCTQPGFYGL